jgi:peptidoglycan/LPS O-acetylase OafA/YrhL
MWSSEPASPPSGATTSAPELPHPAAASVVHPRRPVGVATSVAYLPELESLRGWAMLLVLVFHVDGFVRNPFVQTSGEVVPPWLAFVRAGHTGVSLFFVLSAFLLSLPFFAAARTGRSLSLRRYAARRALRILPLYYAAVVAGALLHAGTLAGLAAALPYFLCLNMLATPLLPYSSVWWSLMTEVQFYLTLPLLWLSLRRRAARWITVALLAVYAVAYGAFLAGRLRLPSFEAVAWLGLSLFGRAPIFLTGIAAAAWYAGNGRTTAERWAARPWLRRGGADMLLWATLLAQAVVLQWVVFVGYNVANSPPRLVFHAVEGGLWACVVLLLLIAPLHSKALLCNRWLSTLGVLSYSVYIVHVPLLLLSLNAMRHAGITGLSGWNARTGIVAPLLVAACIAVSALTYRFIEQPFLIRKETVRG